MQIVIIIEFKSVQNLSFYMELMLTSIHVPSFKVECKENQSLQVSWCRDGATT